MQFLALLLTSLTFAQDSSPYTDPTLNPGPESDWQLEEQVFRRSMVPIGTLDPHLASLVEEFDLVRNLFEGLVSLHPRTGDVLPALAESWEISADQKTYTFHLRPEARWSDGTLLRAHDVVQSLLRAIDHVTAAPYVPELDDIVGAQEYRHSNRPDPSSEDLIRAVQLKRNIKIVAVKDLTVRIEIVAPSPTFLKRLAFPVAMMVPIDRIAQSGDRWSRDDFKGCGPFILKTWASRGDKIILEKNSHYWDAARVKLQRVEVSIYSDISTALKQYDNNLLDVLENPPVARADELTLRPDLDVFPKPDVVYLNFNVMKAPFDDIRVRRAFALAIDSVPLARDLSRHWSLDSESSLIPPAFRNYVVSTRVTDTQRARELLAEAGYPGGKGFPLIEFRYPLDDNKKRIVENIVSQWKAALGVTVRIGFTESNVFYTELRLGQFQLAYDHWTAELIDPHDFLKILMSSDPNNTGKWSNSEFDRLVGQARVETDSVARTHLYQQAEEIVFREVPIAPILYTHMTLLHKDYVHGYIVESPIYLGRPLKYVWIEGRPGH